MTDPLPRKTHCLLVAVLAALSLLLVSAPSTGAASSEITSSDRSAYVLLRAGSRSASMSGSTDDLRRAQSHRAGSEGLLYFRRGRSAWVIRDAATLRRADAIFGPQEALGARQAELGSRQAALGERQARLGARQARLGAQQAGASPARADALGRQQDALGRQQDELGRQQDALGRQQDALGREQDRLGHIADAKFRALLAEALRSGVARRVH